jgi:excisionase family DNA binding protein
MPKLNHETSAPPRAAHTVLEFADMLRIGRTTAYALVGRGEVKSFRVGRKVLIPAAEVERFIERSRQ